jgi:L-alanine-DL-glutamate epimerase-like enolase superfamily enzyme
VREAVGPDVDADRVRFHLPGQAAWLLEPYDRFWLEAPPLRDDAQELARLRRTVPQRLASGEQLHGRRAFRSDRAQAVDVFNRT